VGFGQLANFIEKKFNHDPSSSPTSCRWRGIVALLTLLLPFTAAAIVLSLIPYLGTVVGVLMLYFAIGHKSLHDHARPVMVALQNNDDHEARRQVSRMVSRDSAALDITCATTESVLENGNDGVFGALFWFLIAGGSGAILYRLVNTLDAMWGYRNDRFRYFGWAAARLDDVFNFIPARLTAITYALLGNTSLAIQCWRRQAPAWDSPNAGPVMAAGAGALAITLGGPARYLGEWHQRPLLGKGEAPQINDIESALGLVRHGVWLWTGCLLITAGLTYA